MIEWLEGWLFKRISYVVLYDLAVIFDFLKMNCGDGGINWISVT